MLLDRSGRKWTIVTILLACVLGFSVAGLSIMGFNYVNSGYYISISGTAQEDVPDGISDSNVIEQTEISANEYSMVLSALEGTMKVSDSFGERLDGGEYVQVDGHFYEYSLYQNEPTPLLSGDLFAYGFLYSFVAGGVLLAERNNQLENEIYLL